MKVKTTALQIISFLILIFLSVSANAQVVYVDQSATGTNDGTSWANAYSDLQVGIDAASALSTPALPIQVWVAAGTYKPTSSTDRTISFTMRNEVEIYGGFVGNESSLSQRDWRVNQTVLSGDIGTQGVSGDNSQSVINNAFTPASPLSNTAILDGFIIEDGYMDNASLVGGAGIRNFRASPTVKNCIFRNNVCDAAVNLLGPALVAYNDSYPIIINSEFHHNEGRRASALSIFSTESFSNVPTVKVFGCLFYENTAQQEFGPVVIQTLGVVEFANNTIVDNVIVTPESGSIANFYGSGVTHYGGGFVNLILENNIIWNNGGVYELISDKLTANSNIIGGDLSPNTAVNANLNPYNFDPGFIDAANDEYSLDYCSGANDLGISSGLGNFPTEDLNGNSRIFNSVIDLGAFEEASSIKTTITAVETADVSCNGGSDGLVNFNASASFGPVSYSLDGLSFSAVSSFGGLSPGIYTLYASDGTGCLDSTEFTINEPLPIDITSIATVDVSCNGGSDGELIIEVSGGSAPYQALIDGTAFSQFSSSFTYDQLAVGSYTLAVRDANNCLFSYASGFTISEPSVLSGGTVPNAVDCNGDNSGGITVTAAGGTAPYEYSIDGMQFQSNNEFSSLAAGSYTVTIRDANDCTLSLSETIAEPAVLSLSVDNVTNASCSGKADGSITVSAAGGTAPYEYQFGNLAFGSSSIFNSMANGNYTLRVRDANGCEAEATASVDNDVNISVTAQITNPSCLGESNGEITVSATGGVEPYSYLITGMQNGQVSPTFSGLAAASYLIEVFDNNGCTSEVMVTLIDPAILGVQATVTDVSCNGGDDGQIVVTASGGTSPYEFSIDGVNFQDNATFASLQSGNYTVTVRDGNGCELSEAVVIDEPSQLSLVVTQTGKDFAISASGGTSPYTYSADGINFQASAEFSNLQPGNYNFTVRDANGCESESQVFEVVLGITNPSIAVFPNPTTDVITIEGGDFDKIELYQLDGRKVLESRERRIVVSEEKKGLYLLRMFKGNLEVHNQKLMIN